MNCLDIISSAQVKEEDTYVFVSLETKIEELYADNCVEYSLSPVTAAYYKKYGTYGLSVEEAEHYQKFKENYEMLVELGFIDEAEVPSE
jgi:phenylalanine-4-hydroxylase